MPLIRKQDLREGVSFLHTPHALLSNFGGPDRPPAVALHLPDLESVLIGTEPTLFESGTPGTARRQDGAPSHLERLVAGKISVLLRPPKQHSAIAAVSEPLFRLATFLILLCTVELIALSRGMSLTQSRAYLAFALFCCAQAIFAAGALSPNGCYLRVYAVLGKVAALGLTVTATSVLQCLLAASIGALSLCTDRLADGVSEQVVLVGFELGGSPGI